MKKEYRAVKDDNGETGKLVNSMKNWMRFLGIDQHQFHCDTGTSSSSIPEVSTEESNTEGKYLTIFSYNVTTFDNIPTEGDDIQP